VLVPTGLIPGKIMSWPAKMNLKIISTILAPTTLVRMSQVILRHVAQRTNCFDGPELGTALSGVYPRALMQWHRLAGSSLSAGARETPETPRGHSGSAKARAGLREGLVAIPFSQIVNHILGQSQEGGWIRY
jgi:hypothetical protein